MTKTKVKPVQVAVATYEETDVLELSYGAIQAIAKNAVMGIKKIELTKPQIQQ